MVNIPKCILIYNISTMFSDTYLASVYWHSCKRAHSPNATQNDDL